MALRMRDKVALVLGAGSSGPGWGNGKAAAVLYAREGAKLVAVDVRAEAAAETAKIVASEGGEALALAGDVTDEAQIQAIVAETLARFGRIDVLHNNVGITDIGELEDITKERWQRVMDINLTGAMLASKAVVPAMLQQGGGAIVNISSTAAIHINDYHYYSYSASKAGLNHLTRALAIRYAKDNIRVNAIMPGLMDTPLIHRQIAGSYADTEAMIAARNARSPMGRMGDAWDVARAALFLASDEARYITGVCLPVDGGLTCLAG
ncbi:oxidoreductase [Aliidongia dinghuensis]|uniref:Oxidoreductase n=1 Tax=Aliidongia dinghuensis TaxID=1867774 RepID=A0A8J2YYX3_9PROT|nr:glucose 1-dehydrogenase [Aliidongia dinghuensis]GGF33823.1 oxidoreductase [Aliidongia dinghuensis]